MAPPSHFAVAEGERATLKLTLDTLEVLLGQHSTTPLDQSTVNDSLELAKTTQQQLIDNQRTLTTYASNDAALELYRTEYPTQLTRAIRCASGFRGISMTFPSTSAASTRTAAFSSSTQPADIRLPRLQIPMFSGNLEEWISFRDLFEKAVGTNPALSKAQKLTYLKSYLNGEASRHVTTLVISDANYDVAWDTLTNRYQNERELLFSILRRLLNQPTQGTPSAAALRNLIDTTQGCIRSLEVIRIPVEHWDAILVFTLFNKIDQSSKELWEQSLPNSSVPSLKNLTDFLEQRARALAAGSTSYQPVSGKQERNRAVSSHHAQPQQFQSKCPLCQQSHPLFRCQKFKDFDSHKRTDVLKKNSLCYNCFGAGHGVSACQSKHNCRSCGKRHHTMIHQDQFGSSEPIVSVTSHHAANSVEIDVDTGIIATATINVVDSRGQSMLFRALLDGGSPVSFIEEACAKKLHLALAPSNIAVDGIGCASAGTCQAITSFLIKPYFKSNISYNVKAIVMKKITKKVPAELMDNRSWNHLRDLRLADPNYASPGPIDILIGANLFWEILELEKIRGPPNSPFAVRSTLGWLVAGQSCKRPTQISSFTVNLNLEETVQRFWEAESVPEIPLQTKEERTCEEFFEQTHTRDEDGRYSVRIPWKNPCPPLGSSRPQALQRLFQLERRFNGATLKDAEKLKQLQQHKEDYFKFMDEYEALGHMSPVPLDEISNPAVYISHHFVLKESSTTTRLRVVFDASAKTSSGFSLNDAMMTGPSLQDPIQDIHLRFRKHIIAYTGDLEKMYRQIWIHKDDRNKQRILWREGSSKPVTEYRLNTVTYGEAAAAYLAVKCLQELAKVERLHFPLASEVAISDFYMDDIASGCSTSAEAIEVIAQLIAMFKRARFSLRKFSCNNEEVLQSIPMELRETTSLVEMDPTSSIKTLGIHWNPQDDIYKFTINLPSSTGPVTKRLILSEVSMIYDPVGWLSPVILCAKLLIPDLWRSKIDWNDEVPSTIEERWKTLKKSFKEIEKITIPRCVLPGTPNRTVLVGFSDSSSYGYSACVYTLCYYQDRQPFSTLLTAKTKIAPLQAPTIPRLELNGALLLASLLKSVLRAMKHNFDEVRAYTDSTIVLAWINSSPLRWKTYVRQRVQKINDYCPPAQWYHVRSEENCADCASRGLTPEELLTHPLWWSGNKEMLLQQSTPSPKVTDAVFDSVRSEELRIVNVHHVQTDELYYFISRFSSYRRLQRVTAWLFRFVKNAKQKTPQQQRGPLTVDEVQAAHVCIMLYIQSQEYQTDIQQLKANKQLASSSKILSLSPFLDMNGLLRVGGRLRNANIHKDRKHPILLPQRHIVTKMIITDYHHDFFHAGPQLLLALLQQQFWLTNARDVIRLQIKKCPTCIRHRGETMKQFMGELPSERVNPSHPFSKCGVDYAGPITTRPPIRSKVTLKSYLAIFVCFSTRALHIEVVESLSTDSFLAALRRFTSRRGRPTDIFSDCGTNFVGANRAIKEIVALCTSSTHNAKVADACSTSGIQWHFNPPNSPHFGGLWEAGVRSVKYHLNRVMGSSRYTYEELLTLVTQIEALLNSRPLCPASTDPADLQVLTPAHLLNGAPLTAVPEKDFADIPEGRLSRWQHIQQQKQHFWRRWSKEYITRLQQRPKWMKISPDLNVNDMVIIKDDNLAPAQWSMGRIIAVHPGADDIIRVATVKTCNGEYKRAIHKLCLLPQDKSPPPATANS